MSEISEETLMMLIVHAGTARGYAFEALQYAKDGDSNTAADKIKLAEQEINKAHIVQTDLIQKEACGDKVVPSLLLIHSQDHVMTAMLAKDLIKEMVQILNTIQTLQAK